MTAEKQYLFIEENRKKAENEAAIAALKDCTRQQFSETLSSNFTFDNIQNFVKGECEAILEKKEEFEKKVQKSTDAGVNTIIQMLHRKEDIKDMIIGGTYAYNNKTLLNALKEKQATWLEELETLQAKRSDTKKKATQKEQYLQWRTELVGKFLEEAKELNDPRNYRREEIQVLKNEPSKMRKYLDEKAIYEMGSAGRIMLLKKTIELETTLKSININLDQLTRATNGQYIQLQGDINLQILAAKTLIKQWKEKKQTEIKEHKAFLEREKIPTQNKQNIKTTIQNFETTLEKLDINGESDEIRKTLNKAKGFLAIDKNFLFQNGTSYLKSLQDTMSDVGQKIEELKKQKEESPAPSQTKQIEQ